MIRYIVLGLFFLVYGLNSALAESQFELNKNACDELQRADTSLNKIYQQVLTKYQDDKTFRIQFVNAQRKWIEFRDAYVASMYIPQNQDTYGSAFPMCQCYFIVNITNARMKQLKVWLDGIEEGDVCRGSVK